MVVSDKNFISIYEILKMQPQFYIACHMKYTYDLGKDHRIESIMFYVWNWIGAWSLWTSQDSACPKQLIKGTWHGLSLVGLKNIFHFFFHKLGIYFIVLLRYFYNISNKPVIIINTSNIHSWHKVSNIRRCLDFWNGDIWCTLSAEMNLISKPLAVVIKWW